MKKTVTVLFVDDEPALLEGVRNALRKEPYEIVTAASAALALEMLDQQSITVVVSDEQMPGMSGSQFLAEVRKRHPETIRIILTGQASMEAAIRAINEGEVYRFLSKPCSAAVLAHTIRDSILIRSLSRESTRLLATVKDQRSLLETLEAKHPGITGVDRDTTGAFNIEEDADTIAGLIDDLSTEAERAGKRKAA